jgi:3-phenylpropionate/cinnamic acid dioxygenase small subunit
MTMDLQRLNEATAFIWLESDMLDHREYADWLSLWAADGLYVIPIDPDTDEFEDKLNYVHDDADMRAKRIARLTGGQSISSTPVARTVRSVSRVRVLGERDGLVTVRCAQDLREFRKTRMQQHTSDVTYDLRRHGDSFLIQRKIVRLVNSTDTLTATGFIL